MTDGLPTLTIHQPYASLIVLGVKTIETRSWAAPEALIGRYIGIHAAAKRPPVHWHHRADDELPPAIDLVAMSSCWEWTENVHDYTSGGAYRWVGPLGALVATARLDDCVPMVGEDGDLFEHEPPCLEVRSPGSVNAGLWLWNDPADDEIADVSDQRPYGDFEPGRWAWFLSDIAPTTERCPWCMGAGMLGPESQRVGFRVTCPVCCPDDGYTHITGSCDPIPARGRQRVWYWTPDQGDHR